MKVHVEIDCSPEEARRFMGLPDVEKANAAYVDAVTGAMKAAPNMEQLEEYARRMAPMGQMGLKLFQNFMQGASAPGASGAGAAPEGKKAGQGDS